MLRSGPTSLVVVARILGCELHGIVSSLPSESVLALHAVHARQYELLLGWLAAALQGTHQVVVGRCVFVRVRETIAALAPRFVAIRE